MIYLLDTNVYFTFFKPESYQYDKEKILYQALQQCLKDADGVVRFALCELTTLEIYSVLGKFTRGGGSTETAVCERTLSTGLRCSNLWKAQFQKGLGNVRAGQIYQILKDIECQRGDTQAEIWKINEGVLEEAKMLLKKYAGDRDLRSLDAIIGGSVISAIKEGKEVTLVTLDGKFRSVMEMENVACFKI